MARPRVHITVDLVSTAPESLDADASVFPTMNAQGAQWIEGELRNLFASGEIDSLNITVEHFIALDPELEATA